MKKYIVLFFTFSKIGVMTFGGGMAMLPILQREVVDTKKWVTDDELTDYYAIGQCTPGIIAVNTATFIGNKLYGITGGITATLGLVFPSVVIISFLATVIAMYSKLPVVENAFAGIQVAVCVLILNSVVKLAKTSVIDWLTKCIFVLVVIGSYFSGLSPVFFVIIAGAMGIAAKNEEIKAEMKQESSDNADAPADKAACDTAAAGEDKCTVSSGGASDPDISAVNAAGCGAAISGAPGSDTSAADEDGPAKADADAAVCSAPDSKGDEGSTGRGDVKS